MIHAISRSSCVEGVAIVAGSTYGCNAILSICPDGCDAPNDCNCQFKAQSAVDGYLTQRAQNGLIDPLANIQGLKAWLFSGTADSIVYSCVMQSVQRQLTGLGADVQSVFDIPAAHGWVVDGRDFPYPRSFPRCGHHGPDYLEDCRYDMSWMMFNHLYGPGLLPMASTYDQQLFNNLVAINQAAYVPSWARPAAIGLDRVAFAYVPTACWSNMATCKRHVKYHGCGGGGVQTPRGAVNIFYEETPYIAESNNIVILFPQTVAADSFRRVNPNGCWDWEGYYDMPHFDTHEGAQMMTVLAMLNDLPNAVNAGNQLLANMTIDTAFALLGEKTNMTALE